MTGSRAERSAHLGLLMLGVCLALVVSEIGLRLAGTEPRAAKVAAGRFDWLSYDPIMAWRNKAGYSHEQFRINLLGFRGDEVLLGKPPGTFRIVCSGDSRTFGIRMDRGGWRFDSDYPAALGDLLRSDAAASAIEVINAGVVGYTSAHGLRQLVIQILEMQPDVVVASFGLNDHLPSWNPALRAQEPHNFLVRSLFYTVEGFRSFQFGVSFFHGIASLHPPAMSVRWVEPDGYAYNLRRFADISRAHGIRLLLLSQALRPIELGQGVRAVPKSAEEMRAGYRMLGARDLPDLHRIEGEYERILRRVAEEERIPLADAAAAFASHRGEPLFGMYDLFHSNVAGARRIARVIHDRLGKLGWIPDGTSVSLPPATTPHVR